MSSRDDGSYWVPDQWSHAAESPPAPDLQEEYTPDDAFLWDRPDKQIVPGGAEEMRYQGSSNTYAPYANDTDHSGNPGDHYDFSTHVHHSARLEGHYDSRTHGHKARLDDDSRDRMQDPYSWETAAQLDHDNLLGASGGNSDPYYDQHGVWSSQARNPSRAGSRSRSPRSDIGVDDNVKDKPNPLGYEYYGIGDDGRQAEGIPQDQIGGEYQELQSGPAHTHQGPHRHGRDRRHKPARQPRRGESSRRP